MNKPSQNINVIKCIDLVRAAIGESTKNDAERDKKELEVLLFDETVDFVRCVARKLDKYYENKENGS